MNTAAAIEIAVATVLRQFATLGEGVVVRAWQSPDLDPLAEPVDERYFPALDVESDPSGYNSDLTASVTCLLRCRTKAADDGDRVVLREMFSEAERVARALFGQFHGAGGDELTAWKEAFAVATAGDQINLDSVSIEWGDIKGKGIDTDGAQYIAISLVFHYSREDF